MGSLDFFTSYFAGATSSYPVVYTNYGQVEGIVETSRDGFNYYNFKGMPYAKPPVGDLRFSDPRPPEKWKGVRQAKTNPIFCFQLMAAVVQSLKYLVPPMGSEDCLYLSVATRTLDEQAKRPVLVYFHGGAWIGWGGPTFFKPTFIMDHDLVIVMANYRLATFGFLSFEDDVLPGNLGLKDQLLALQWVKDNIKYFGGDPNRVTVMGESAGGASVHYHSFAPKSQGLFHQIIPMSGTAYAFWAYTYPGDARLMAFQYAKHLGCPVKNSTVALDCLRKVSPFRLARASSVYFGLWDIEPTRNLGPVFEKDRPGSLLPSSTKKWKPVSVPMLLGEVNGEGLLKTLLYKSPFKGKDWNWISKYWSSAIPFSLKFNHNHKAKKIAEKIRNYWFQGKELMDDSILTNMTHLYTIVGMRSPGLHMIEEATNTVYHMRFGYLGEMSPSLLVNDGNVPKLTFHAEYMIYILQVIFMPSLRGQDLQVSKNLTSMIANFVIHGDPTPDTGLWRPWTKTGYDTLIIDNKGINMVAEGLPKDVAQWRSLCAYKNFFDCHV